MEDNELQFQDLSKKQKCEHIWEYYKLHIFGTIFVIIVILSLVFKKPAPELFCGIGIYGPHVNIDSITLMENNLGEMAQVPEGYEIDVTNFFLTEDDQLQDVDMINKFQTYIMTLQLHLVASNEERFVEFLQADYIAPLSDYLTEDEINQLASENKIYYGKGVNDTEDKPYGIKIDDATLLKDNNILQDNNMYMGFVPIQDNTENTLNVLRKFLD